MGIFTVAPPYDKIHGKIMGESGVNGQVVYSTRTAGNVYRNYVIPANPQSTLQVVVRAALAAAAAAWKDITEAQAYDWNVKAATIYRTNILGVQYSLTGIGLYCEINTYRQLNAQAIVDVLPTIVAPVKPVGITSVTQTSATVLTIIANFTGNDDGYFGICRVSAPLPGEARQARVGDCRLRDATIANNIIAVATNSVTFPLTVPSGYYTALDRIGIYLMPTSDEYFAGEATLISNYEIAAP